MYGKLGSEYTMEKLNFDYLFNRRPYAQLERDAKRGRNQNVIKTKIAIAAIRSLMDDE